MIMLSLAISAVAATAEAQQPVFPGNRMVPTMPGTTAAAPGPKKANTVRVGVAPSQAQMGQGSNAQGDYGTPIRNSIVLLMSGPAVEIVALDAHLAMQLQAEAREKQAAAVLPMAGVGAGVGGAMAGQAAGIAAMAAAQSAQEMAINQLAGFNGQIKSKDDVTVGYRLTATGQDKARLENTLKAKASTDGEDVLTPLILQAAEAILTEVTKN
jgi:hypothetical protein